MVLNNIYSEHSDIAVNKLNCQIFAPGIDSWLELKVEGWFDVIILHIQIGHSDCAFSSLKFVFKVILGDSYG